MKCPRCSEFELKTVKAADIEVDQCPNCLGIWFDMTEMTALRDKTDLGEIQLKGKPGVRRTIVPLNCPRDNSTMDMVNDVKAGDVQLDVCPTCGGRWLDGGELDRLREKGLFANIKNFFVTYIAPE